MYVGVYVCMHVCASMYTCMLSSSLQLREAFSAATRTTGAPSVETMRCIENLSHTQTHTHTHRERERERERRREKERKRKRDGEWGEGRGMKEVCV